MCPGLRSVSGLDRGSALRGGGASHVPPGTRSRDRPTAWDEVREKFVAQRTVERGRCSALGIVRDDPEVDAWPAGMAWPVSLGLSVREIGDIGPVRVTTADAATSGRNNEWPATQARAAASAPNVGGLGRRVSG